MPPCNLGAAGVGGAWAERATVGGPGLTPSLLLLAALCCLHFLVPKTEQSEGWAWNTARWAVQTLN